MDCDPTQKARQIAPHKSEIPGAGRAIARRPSLRVDHPEGRVSEMGSPMPALAATTHDDPVLKRSNLVADAEEDAAPPRLPHSWRLPVALLSIGWALAFAVLTACAAALNLAGASFSSPSFHTLPLAVLSLSSGLHNLLLPREMAVLGRWRAYLLGALLGCAGCLTCFAACEAASMALLCCGSVLIGVGLAHSQNYRFGVLLCVPDAANHPVAISWVLAGMSSCGSKVHLHTGARSAAHMFSVQVAWSAPYLAPSLPSTVETCLRSAPSRACSP